MQSKAETVAAYLEELPEDRRAALTRLRALVRKVAPDAAEVMRFGMPSYDLGGPLFALAAQKQYLALYVCEAEVLAANRPRLGKLSCGKGCIRFRRLDELPLGVVADILKEARQRRKAGPGPKG